MGGNNSKGMPRNGLIDQMVDMPEMNCCSLRHVGPPLGGKAPLYHTVPPPALLAFLKARSEGHAQAAADLCSPDVIMRGPMGEFRGIEAVRVRAFQKKSQTIKRELTPLQYIPEKSAPGEAVYAREFEAQIADRSVSLRQEFTVVNPESHAARICLVVFEKLDSSRKSALTAPDTP